MLVVASLAVNEAPHTTSVPPVEPGMTLRLLACQDDMAHQAVKESDNGRPQSRGGLHRVTADSLLAALQ